MTETNKRYYIWALVITVLLIYAVLYLVLIGKRQPTLIELLKLVPTTVTLELLVFGAFKKWIWKWKILHPWFVVMPDLSGKWEGTLHYKWKGQEGDRDISLTIIQSFNHIVVKLETTESTSRSVAAFFDIDERRGIYDLYCTYINEPLITIQDRSKIHFGTTRLSFDLNVNTTIRGEYWTSRDTKGLILLTRVFAKRKRDKEIPINTSRI